MRVWLKRWKKSARLWVISTHTPVRVWLCLLDPYNLKYAHFNSHTREGVTVNLCNIKIKFAISTHTPVRVWLTGIKKAVGTYKFQLTHPWGCDVSADAGITASWNFNSHTREGVTCLSPFIFSRLVISTHTPVRVWQDQNYYSYYHCAISTHTPVRVWRIRQKKRNRTTKFQLTHPWGCDLSTLWPLQAIYHFNSHTREGVTIKELKNHGKH